MVPRSKLRRSKFVLMSLVAGFALPAAGCVVESHPVRPAPAAVVVTQAPPPPPRAAEYVPPPPPAGPGVVYVWQPGHWRWNGHEYVWFPGQYAERPAHVERWIPPHWDERGGQWFYVEGRWA
jgi:hypothetical protein